MKIRVLLLAILITPLFFSCEKECECPPEAEEKTLTTQPGPNNGQDCMVAYRENDGGLYASGNNNFHPDFGTARWTWNNEGAGEGTIRAYLRFPEVSDIPADAVIKSAKLSLYGPSSSAAVPQGNSIYPGSPYSSYNENKSWLKRAIGSWDEATITWNNKPGTTDEDQVEIGSTTSQWNYNVTDIDVTNLVKPMVANGKNYGFVLQLQNESIYRCNIFASSESADASRRPKLVVVYEVQ